MASSNANIFVYILQSQSTDRYYIGVTKDVQHRLQQHNAGHTTSTRGKGPWKLVYTESYSTRREARSREAVLKRKKSHRYLSWIIENQ